MASQIWRLILKSLGCRIPFKEALFIKMATAPIKNIMPLRSGELIRAVYLKKKYNFPLFKGIYSIAIEYALKLFILFVFVLFGYVLFKGISHNLVFFSLLIISISLLLIYFLYKRRYSLRGFFKVPRQISLREMAVILFFYSVIIQGGELINFSLLSQAVNVDTSLQSIVIFASLVVIISALPITIMGLGTRESAVVFFFSKYATFDKLLALGILFSFVESLFPLVICLFFTRSFVNKLITIK